jgi:nitroimidazol reductase NimA-like FMN-containing flavoprotein (pyridoxamine 5'-phosphate oxidase superfamily)
MRRAKQLLPVEMTEEILRTRTHGVLALQSEDGYPYAVPISYVFSGGKIYFHCATSGHKIDLIQANEKVSFCVIDQDQVVPEELTTYFRSVIVFGRAKIVEDEQEKKKALDLLTAKYSPGYEQESQLEIQKQWRAIGIVGIEIDHLTGKEAIELVRARQ